jgi:hypothetical protein
VYQKKAYQRKAQETPYQQLQRAIEIAQEKGVHVIGHGTMKADGSHFWIVPSQSVEGMCHVVKKASNDTLSCDCYYSAQRGKVCAHRAAVYLALKAAPIAPSKPEMPRQPVKTMAQRAEEALPVGPEPFSIYKTEKPRAGYKPVAARAQEDAFGERADYVPADYRSHEYR